MTSTIQFNLRVPFGLRDGRMVSPDEVESGRACACECSECGAPLIAKKGETLVWHFAHDGTACKFGAETAIHLMAKQILAEERKVNLPPAIVSITATDAFGHEQTVSKVLAPALDAQYETVVLEVTKGSRRPDAVGNGGNVPIEHRIEVFVRHPVDRAKARELEDADCACFEICLNDLNGAVSKDSLRTAVVSSSARVRWISYPGQQHAKAELSRQLEVQLEVQLEEVRRRNEEADKESREFYAARADEELEEQDARRRYIEDERLAKRQAAQRVKRKAEANATFKAASEADKRTFVFKKLRIDGNTTPPMLNSLVRGDKSFGVARSIWQADVFRRFIFNRFDTENGELSLEVIFSWVQHRYEYAPQFTNSGVVALWDYLVSLEKLGYVKHIGRQAFKVLKDDAPWLDISAAEPLHGWFWSPGARSLSLDELENANATLVAPLSPLELTTLFLRVRARHDVEEPASIARTVFQRTGRSPIELLNLLSKAEAVTHLYA